MKSSNRILEQFFQMSKLEKSQRSEKSIFFINTFVLRFSLTIYFGFLIYLKFHSRFYRLYFFSDSVKRTILRFVYFGFLKIESYDFCLIWFLVGFTSKACSWRTSGGGSSLTSTLNVTEKFRLSSSRENSFSFDGSDSRELSWQKIQWQMHFSVKFG